MRIKYAIIGSGGFAKEVYFLAESRLNLTHQFIGFIDVEPSQDFVIACGKKMPVFKESMFLDQFKFDSTIELFLGIGNPKISQIILPKYANFKFPNLIHENFVGHIDSIEMGTGNIVTAGCIFTVDIKIGSFNIFNLTTTIGHDCKIGDFNIFNPAVNISGGVTIGSENLFGTSATVLQNLVIGDGIVLGASSLATKNIENNSVMIGIPARKMINE